MDSMDSLGSDLHDHRLSSSADLFLPNDQQQHNMDSAADQAQHQESDGRSSSNSLSPFLNGTGGSNMGMAGVMAALQSLGSNTRAPNMSEEEQATAEDNANTQGQGQFREQIMLEQFKLAQLKQLQELQQQIFQQQMALIHGGSTSLESQPPRDQTQQQRGFHGLPTPGSSTELRPSHPISVEFVSPMLLNYDDMDSSAMPLDISTQSQYSRNNSASHTPVFSPHDPSGLDMDMGNFSALTPLSATSTNNPHFGDNFTSSFDTSNSSGNATVRAQEHFFAHRGTASAPAHIAFGNPYHSSHYSSHHHGMNMSSAMNPMNMSSEPSSPLHSELDFDISPLTSPWLGAKMTGSSGVGGSNGRVQAYGHHHSQSQYHQQLPHSAVHAGTKRAASPTSADIDVDVVFGGSNSVGGRSRKRQASISQPPNTMRPSANSDNSNNSDSRSSRGSSSGSKSMNSTPLMRGTNPSSRTRRGSMVISSPLAMAMGGGGNNYPGISSPMGDSNSSLAAIRGVTRNAGHGSNNNTNMDSNSNFGLGAVGDSPSPVDLSLSMPPPAAPASTFGADTEVPESLVPVTPASIMNLGGSFAGLGGGLGGSNGPHQQAQNQSSSSSGKKTRNGNASTSTSGNSTASKTTGKVTGKGANKNDVEGGTSVSPAGGTRKSVRRVGGSANGAGDNSGLKHILPAGNSSSSQSNPSSNLIPLRASTSASSTNTIVPLKERKTSHKAAEQKRRDSLKTTFDDLRGLLPPIPLPTDESKSGTVPMDDGTGIGFIALAKASLLPGALPPRGPPKAGGEGPNKGVSKLQLLICGNEYIRVLKGRVERRDEEVERLRREVRRLRARLTEGGNGNGFEGLGEDEPIDGNCDNNGFDSEYGDILDLDKDLDAVEVLESMRASASGALASMNGGGMLSGVDEDEED